jgi:hypothetical protein
VVIRNQNIRPAQVPVYNILAVKVLDALRNFEELDVNLDSTWESMRVIRLTKRFTSPKPRAFRYFKTLPYFVHGETMQNDAGNVSRSMPKRG